MNQISKIITRTSSSRLHRCPQRDYQQKSFRLQTLHQIKEYNSTPIKDYTSISPVSLPDQTLRDHSRSTATCSPPFPSTAVHSHQYQILFYSITKYTNLVPDDILRYHHSQQIRLSRLAMILTTASSLSTLGRSNPMQHISLLQTYRQKMTKMKLSYSYVVLWRISNLLTLSDLPMVFLLSLRLQNLEQGRFHLHWK